VIHFRFDLTCTTYEPTPVAYGCNGESVIGVSGRYECTREGGEIITVDAGPATPCGDRELWQSKN
jgi:hypothetical protein